MPSHNSRFPRNSLVENTGLDILIFPMQIREDYWFPICDVTYCGTYIPADSSSVLTADKNLKTPHIHYVKIHIRVYYYYYYYYYY
jgi:hypothetical protein